MTKKKTMFVATAATISIASAIPHLHDIANAETIDFYSTSTSPDSGTVENSFATVDNGDGTLTITNYTGTAKDIDIPAVINGKPVKAIKSSTFQNKGLTSVVIGNGVKEIGSYAFANNSLTAVVIPASVTTIGDYAFTNNELRNVTVPSSVTTLGVGAFKDNSISSYILPNNLTVIPDNLFDGNQITHVAIQSSVTSIGNNSFSNNLISTLDISYGLKLIGDGTFQNNRLTSLYLPESVVSVGGNAFKGNPVKSITIPETLSSIVSQITSNVSSLNSLNLYKKGKDPGYDSGTSGSSGNTEDEVVLKLGLEAGDLTLVKPELAKTSFGNIQLEEENIEESIPFTTDLYISDTRGTNEGWTLTVEATPFKEVPKSGGKAPSGGWFELPEGTISIAGIDGVYKVDSNGNRSNASSDIEYERDENIVIDSGAVDLVTSKRGNSFGVWAVKFDSEGIKINIQPDGQMVDNENYEDEPTPYTSTITWTLVSGPGK